MLTRTIITHDDHELQSFLDLYALAIHEDVKRGNMVLDPDEWQEKPLDYWREQ